MRVCHVITKPELGGAQLSTLNILSSLPRDKYDIFVITSSKGTLSPEFRDLKRAKSFLLPSLTRPINPILDILAFIHIYAIYSCNNFDIVHTHSSKAGMIGRWAARIAGVRVIIHTVHGWSFHDCQPHLLRGFYIFLERITASVTTKIICVSKKDIETGLKHKIAPKEKFVFIKYGIPLPQFRKQFSSPDRVASDGKERIRRELGITNNDPIVGMISSLKPQKAPIDYIKACIKIYEKLPNVNFLLVGDGVLKARCKRALAEAPLNGRFIFAGWRMDISQILDILDVVVLTSRWEGMPISVIEALCKGCLVVATNVGGTPELVKDGITGYITRPGSYEEVAMKVLKILEDPNSFSKMKREASLSIDDSFDVNRMISEIDSLYKYTIKNIL